VKRLALVAVPIIVLGVLVFTYPNDPVYWKRRALASIYSPATMPAAYYEPTALIEGTEEGGNLPRVAPELEKLGSTSLQAAVDYASERKSTALIVGRHGHIAFEHYWNGTSFDTVIDAGDFNATLTALMVGMAMNDRKIALVAEPVGNYIESFRDGDRATITLEDLLQMSSGLSASSPQVQLVQDVRTACLDADAGTAHKWAPNACDPQLLAHIIERATGEPYASFVSSRLWKPIGARNAYLMLDRKTAWRTQAAACERGWATGCASPSFSSRTASSAESRCFRPVGCARCSRLQRRTSASAIRCGWAGRSRRARGLPSRTRPRIRSC
jgi:CubicO group peptidase (beta-lactamase class C family)